ncbi:MAG: hypothetical protein ACJA0Z_002487 [Halioglobus sp.]|jgi:hypothetical protein
MNLKHTLIPKGSQFIQFSNTTDIGLKALIGLASILVAILPGAAFAHGVDEGTQQFLASNEGVAILPFLYIGAKHMTIYSF